MDRQTIHINEYGWVVECYYSYEIEDIDFLLNCVADMGCDGDDLLDAIYTIEGRRINEAFTYTNNATKKTMIVFCPASDAGQFFNTWNHEKDHVVKHIVKAIGIDPFQRRLPTLTVSYPKGCLLF